MSLSTRPRLSVVVPFYGVQDYIGDCLESIRVQQLQNIEVVMVDDGSLDGSRDVAQEYADRDSRFRIVTQENAGLGPARNTGTANSSGEYLTFIDSDDLVTRHGFTQMVESLDETGSSFAGGNARRFNNSTGVKPSWAHLHAFAMDWPATHVTEHAVLARDRMVWNKVYRRSFWDEYGYEFPAIRYEDYPVTIKAHLDAVTVDILSEPVYYWRERESGDSITQQVYRYDNLVDRVRSAGMVIDLVASAPKAVRMRTHVMLAESDFLAIVQAFATVPDADVDRIIELGHGFVERLGLDALLQRPRFDQLQYHAMMARDVELLRELAVFRQDGGLRGGARAVKTPRSLSRYEYLYPGRDRSYIPRDTFLSPAADLSLRTAVNDVRFVDDDLRIQGTAEVRHLRSNANSRIKVFAVSKSLREEVPVRRFKDIDSHGQLSDVGFELRIPRDQLARWSVSEDAVRFDLQISSNGKRKQGLVKGLRPGSATWQPGAWVTPTMWLQPESSPGAELQLSWRPNPWRLVDGHIDGTDLIVEAIAPRPLQVAQFILDGSQFADELRYPATCVIEGDKTRITGRLPLLDVQAHTDDDDPYLQMTTRAVRVRAAGVNEDLTWTGTPRSVGTQVGEHQFRLLRDPENLTFLRETAVRLTADEVVLEGDGDDAELVARGRNWTGTDSWTLAWRRYLPGTEEFLETTPAQTGAESWEVRTPVRELLDVPGVVSDIDPLASLANWTLFCSSEDRNLATAVLPEPFLIATLPVIAHLGTHRGTLRQRADTLHLEIRDDR